jgi:hypothetical protein
LYSSIFCFFLRMVARFFKKCELTRVMQLSFIQRGIQLSATILISNEINLNLFRNRIQPLVVFFRNNFSHNNDRDENRVMSSFGRLILSWFV